MIRNKSKSTINNVDAILTADWHLRETIPTCYLGDYEKDQWETVDFVSELQSKYNCPILHAGDLFDHWKPSPNLLSKSVLNLPHQFFSVAGQHDLPQHNSELIEKSGIWNLYINGLLEYSSTGSWNDENPECNFQFKNKEILVWHKFNYQGKKPWPDCKESTGKSLLKKYPQFDLIVTGDNHQPFVEEYEGRLLVNCGSLMRMTAAQIDFKPRVWLWDANLNQVEPAYLPIKDNVISREHLEVSEQRDHRIDAFISELNTNFKTTLSFEDNLKQFKQNNQIRESVMEIIYKSIEE